jgi:predicted ArsR family transcriptional regulator
MMSADDTAAIAAAAVLADDLRQRLYAFIRRADRPVTRDQAAAAVGISRKLAAFHLDKLVDAGLLRAGSARPAGMHRPGRAAKTYQPSGTGIQISIPPRRLAVLAEILLDAVTAGTARPDPRQAAFAAASGHGRVLGAAERRHARPGRLGAERALTLALPFLERFGFEPARTAPGIVVLRNCPYQPLAAREPGLVCGINQAFLAGFLDGLGTSAAAAVLNPRPGTCCVELRAAGAA